MVTRRSRLHRPRVRSTSNNDTDGDIDYKSVINLILSDSYKYNDLEEHNL